MPRLTDTSPWGGGAGSRLGHGHGAVTPGVLGDASPLRPCSSPESGRVREGGPQRERPKCPHTLHSTGSALLARARNSFRGPSCILYTEVKTNK